MPQPAGRFTLQAAVAAEHARAPDAAGTDRPQVLRLHDGLLAEWRHRSWRSTARSPSPRSTARHALCLAADPADRAFLQGRLCELAG